MKKELTPPKTCGCGNAGDELTSDGWECLDCKEKTMRYYIYAAQQNNTHKRRRLSELDFSAFKYGL